jgi:hypothetical protein
MKLALLDPWKSGGLIAVEWLLMRNIRSRFYFIQVSYKSDEIEP